MFDFGFDCDYLEYIHIMYVYFLLLLFDLRLANNNYVTNFLQSNTYLQQPKLPACCDFFVGPRPEVFTKKGLRPVSIRTIIRRSQLGLLHSNGIFLLSEHVINYYMLCGSGRSSGSLME